MRREIVLHSHVVIALVALWLCVAIGRNLAARRIVPGHLRFDDAQDHFAHRPRRNPGECALGASGRRTGLMLGETGMDRLHIVFDMIQHLLELLHAIEAAADDVIGNRDCRAAMLDLFAEVPEHQRRDARIPPGFIRRVAAASRQARPTCGGVQHISGRNHSSHAEMARAQILKHHPLGRARARRPLCRIRTARPVCR